MIIINQLQAIWRMIMQGENTHLQISNIIDKPEKNYILLWIKFVHILIHLRNRFTRRIVN